MICPNCKTLMASGPTVMSLDGTRMLTTWTCKGCLKRTSEVTANPIQVSKTPEAAVKHQSIETLAKFLDRQREAYIRSALTVTHGKRAEAAKLIGVSQSTISRFVKR